MSAEQMMANMQMLQANGGTGGSGAILGMLNELPANYLESMCPISETMLEKFLKSIFPQLQQAFIFNFQGGSLWKLLFAKICEILNQKGDLGGGAGISGGSDVGHGGSIAPSEGGGDKGSGAPGLGAD